MPYALDYLDSAGSSPRCPYHDGGSKCLAALSGLPPDRLRVRNYCSCEDYDLCPLYLARLLRSTRPRYCGATRQDLLQK